MVKQKQKQPNNNKQGNKGINKNAGPSKKIKVTKTNPLYEPNRSLEGPELKRFVKQKVRQQIRPALREAHRTIQELQQEKNTALQREALLGRQATGNTATYYQQLAAQEAALLAQGQAAGGQAVQQVQAAGQAGVQGVNAAGVAAQQGLGENTSGQDIGSRQRLAQMVAEYGSQAAQNASAQNAYAANQAGNWAGLRSQMAGASQMRGQEQLSDINRTIQNRVGELGNEYNRNINKVRGIRQEILKSRPEIFAKTLAEARKEQSDLNLSKRALGIKEEENKKGVNYSNTNLKNEMKRLNRKAELRDEEMERQGANEQERNEEQNRFREKEFELQERYAEKFGGGGKGGGKNGEKGAWRNGKEAWAALLSHGIPRSEVAEGGTTKLKDGSVKHYSAKEIQRQLKTELMVNGVGAAMADKLIKRYINQYRKKVKRTVGQGIKIPLP